MPKRTDFQSCAGSQLRQASRVATNYFDSYLARTGLRLSQLTILITLRSAGSKNINELANILVLDRTTLGRNLRPLKRDRYLEIVPGKKDRRARMLTLTSKGEAIALRAMDEWAHAQTSFEKLIGPRDTIALSRLLQKVVNISTRSVAIFKSDGSG
jgi:DNA-binding MarR family transcriptional regulator